MTDLMMDSMDSCASSGSPCWICLQDGDDLRFPCSCPRAVHPRCLAQWQLQQAGREEEHTCRFCNQELPDWRPILTPKNVTPQVPVVSVHFNGTCYRLRVRPGVDGFDSFRRQLQRITGLPLLECVQITFQCKSPDGGADAASRELCFKGLSAFDAAIHCASISAAARLDRQNAASGSAPPSSPADSPSSSSSSPSAASSSSSSPAIPADADALPSREAQFEALATAVTTAVPPPAPYVRATSSSGSRPASRVPPSLTRPPAGAADRQRPLAGGAGSARHSAASGSSGGSEGGKGGKGSVATAAGGMVDRARQFMRSLFD